MPQGVNQAIIGIWVTIGLSVFAALFSKWVGEVSTPEFVGSIIAYAIFCVFPYKLANGSNPARWVYTILMGLSVLFVLGGVELDMPKADMAVSIVTLPIQIFIIFRLFQPEASMWFSRR